VRAVGSGIAHSRAQSAGGQKRNLDLEWEDAVGSPAQVKGQHKRLRKGDTLLQEGATVDAPAPLERVDTTTKCPTSGARLRVRDLIPVKFEVSDQAMFDNGGGRGVFCCAVTKQPIIHQQAVLLKPSGHVVLDSVLADCVYKDKRCPATGVNIRGPCDVLKLQRGGSGFAAHNDVQVKSFVTIRSRTNDDRLPGTHLPAAGYVGLR